MNSQQATIYTAILIAAIVTGAILIYFIVSLVYQQRRNYNLYKLNLLAGITTLENERIRIASDLHDELGPLLSAIKLKLSCVETKIPDDEKIMEATRTHILDIITRMREISNDLMPNTLLRKGLIFAIEEFINKMYAPEVPNGAHKSLKINFTYRDVPELSKEKTINLYRIVLEIIHNTIKHANASLLTINMESRGNDILLFTKDDGIGFDWSLALQRNSGLGLRSLLSRLEIMGGKLYLDHKPGEGTAYKINLPIK